MENKFHDELHHLIDTFVHRVYDETASFPRGEVFGVTSQLRRAALSVMLNYIEGYARQRKLVLKNFLEIAYGSLKESRYLITFSHQRKYLSDSAWKELDQLSNRIGAMLWGVIVKIK